ncbi:MAG: putative sporulation protein YtxC [Bacillota bacterium]
MQVLSIGADKHIKQIRDRLDYELKFLEEEGITVSVRESNRGNLTFLGCDVVKGQRANGQDLSIILKQFVANALSDVIINDWEATLIRKLVKESYNYLNQEELDAVCAFVSKSLDGRTSEGSDLVQRIDRKARILARLLDFLDRHDEVVVDGFITFRLRDYIEELEDAVDRAVDDYLMEKEYKEFIRLLRYFIEMQESRIDEVHVLVSPNGVYKLVDGENQPLRSEQLDEFVVEMIDGDLEYEDLLVSSLIALAPRLVTVHVRDTQQHLTSIDTLRSIFAERLIICNGCKRCAPGRVEERGVVKHPKA